MNDDNLFFHYIQACITGGTVTGPAVSKTDVTV